MRPAKMYNEGKIVDLLAGPWSVDPAGAMISGKVTPAGKAYVPGPCLLDTMFLGQCISTPWSHLSYGIWDPLCHANRELWVGARNFPKF
jgi:hypothetical protein